jgi:hypothetical protein
LKFLVDTNMNTPQQSKHEHSAPNPATTTEELIVQYLDGELHRKELESVLFGRLAESEEARTMLHEHLVLRGAIRASANDERYQLSESLDTRTRDRIEQALKISQPAPAIRTDAVTRRTQRWVLRPSLAALLLLLSVGTTWFVTRSTTAPQIVTAPQVAQTQSAPAPSVQSSSVNITAPTATEETHSAVTHQAVKSHVVAKEATPQFAQNTVAAPKVEEKQDEITPADLMISKRFSRILNAVEKHEIVVNSKDRL